MDRNPCRKEILVQIIQSWIDASRSDDPLHTMGWKRALKAIRKGPEEYHHPSETKKLDNVGPGIVAKLTNDLAMMCRANGWTMPEPGRRRRKRNVANEQDEAAEAGQAEASKRSKPSAPKQYVPRLRSAGYGIMLALYGDGEEILRLTKKALIDRAQPFCDTNLSIRERGAYCSGWSSINTVMKNGLVWSDQRRYFLSDKGRELARVLANARDGDPGNGAGEVGEGPAPLPTAARSNTKPSRGRATAGTAGSSNGRRLPQIRRNDESADEDESADPLALDNPALRRAREEHAELEALYYEPMVYGERLPYQPPLPGGSGIGSSSQGLHLRSAFDSPGRPLGGRPLGNIQPATAGHVSANIQRRPLGNTQPATAGHVSANIQQRHSMQPIQIIEDDDDIQVIDPQSLNRPASMGQSAASNPLPASKYNGASPSRVPQTVFSATAGTSSATRSASSSPSMLKAGTYDIQLIVDNRERRTTGDWNYIQDELTKKGCLHSTRGLNLGDFMWVAREHGPNPRQIVLDHIIERKRLDDLISSIESGRFHEQKFRMKKSGIRHVTYVIEMIRVPDVSPARQSAIDTAISSMQVVDGFFVKRTPDLDHTIRYVVRMTEKLKRKYKDQDIYIVPSEACDSQTYTSTLADLRKKDSKEWGIAMKTFSELVSKSGNLTLKDVFLKMLMCSKGISLDKAIEIQKVYNVPATLIEAYERCTNEHEKENLIKNATANAIGRMSVGSAFSRQLSEVWGCVDDF